MVLGRGLNNKPCHINFYILLTVHPDIMTVFSNQSSRNLCTEQSPKESDDTRCRTNTTVLLKMSTIVLETCRGM